MLVVTQHPMRKQTSASFPNVWWQSGQKHSRAGHRVLPKYHMDRRQIHRGRQSHDLTRADLEESVLPDAKWERMRADARSGEAAFQYADGQNSYPSELATLP